MYKFKINGQMWDITDYEGSILQEKYNKMLEDYNGEKEEYMYYKGFCNKITHEIGININQCYDEVLNTLRHELMHCYLTMTGHQEDVYSEEKVCDIYAFAHDFIEKVVNGYKEAHIIKNEAENDDRA